MVYFLCDGCNETLKKNKVDAHAAKCRICYAVSCVDCSVSFPGDEYRTHTSCISEAERYEKTVYKGVRKADQNGNSPKASNSLTKQEKWLLTIEKAADSSPPSLKSYMDQLTMLENIPTQEKKFRNFAANSLRLKRSDERIVMQIWEVLMKEKQKEVDATDKKKEDIRKRADASNGDESAKISDSENSKEMKENQELTKNITSDMSKDSFPSDTNIKKSMKKALKKASNKTLKFKSLRKEVKESLMLKAENEKAESELKLMDDKKWKELMKRIVRENPEKMKLDGKSVQLIEH